MPHFLNRNGQRKRQTLATELWIELKAGPAAVSILLVGLAETSWGNDVLASIQTHTGLVAGDVRWRDHGSGKASGFIQNCRDEIVGSIFVTTGFDHF